MPLMCRVHEDRPATERVRWTVYGGAYKYQLVCDDCLARTRGQRGIEPVGLPGRPKGGQVRLATSSAELERVREAATATERRFPQSNVFADLRAALGAVEEST